MAGSAWRFAERPPLPLLPAKFAEPDEPQLPDSFDRELAGPQLECTPRLARALRPAQGPITGPVRGARNAISTRV